MQNVIQLCEQAGSTLVNDSNRTTLQDDFGRANRDDIVGAWDALDKNEDKRRKFVFIAGTVLGYEDFTRVIEYTVIDTMARSLMETNEERNRRSDELYREKVDTYKKQSDARSDRLTEFELELDDRETAVQEREANCVQVALDQKSTADEVVKLQEHVTVLSRRNLEIMHEARRQREALDVIEQLKYVMDQMASTTT